MHMGVGNWGPHPMLACSSCVTLTKSLTLQEPQHQFLLTSYGERQFYIKTICPGLGFKNFPELLLKECLKEIYRLAGRPCGSFRSPFCAVRGLSVGTLEKR